MKKRISVILLFAMGGSAYTQLPSLNKAKSLAGSKSNNSGTSTTNSTGSSTTNTSSNNTAGNNTSNNGAANAATATISFSNSSGQISSSYSDGDPISAKVDFTTAMKDIGGKKYNDVFVINLFDGTKFLNGKKLSFLKDEDLSKPSFEFQMACSIDQAKSPLAEDFTKTLVKLGKGSHTIKVKMIRLDKFNNELAVAEGTFQLDLSNGKDKLQGQADSYDAKEIEARRMPEAAMKNAGIEKDLKRLISNDVDEPITPLRAVIAETDWEIIRSDYNNVITGRIIAGYVAFKVTRNGRCFYKKLTIYQPYTGGGNYGLSKYYDSRVSSDILELNCDNVMK